MLSDDDVVFFEGVRIDTELTRETIVVFTPFTQAIGGIYFGREVVDALVSDSKILLQVILDRRTTRGSYTIDINLTSIDSIA